MPVVLSFSRQAETPVQTHIPSYNVRPVLLVAEGFTSRGIDSNTPKRSLHCGLHDGTYTHTHTQAILQKVHLHS